jgi:hypothetical protein
MILVDKSEDETVDLMKITVLGLFMQGCLFPLSTRSSSNHRTPSCLSKPCHSILVEFAAEGTARVDLASTEKPVYLNALVDIKT